MKRNLRIIGILILCVSALGVDRAVGAQQRIDDYSSKFDEFHGPNWEGAMARLDNFALDMQNNPNMIGVLIVYGGQRRRRGESRAWSDCLEHYLVSQRGIERNRLVMINGGYREDLTVELWKTANKNHLPNPAPHVKSRDVRFKKGKVKPLCEI